MDDHAAGLATIKSFRTRQYRREMDSYASHLGGEKAKLTDMIEHLMEDIFEFDDDVSPKAWRYLSKNSTLEQRLRRRLGRNYNLCKNSGPLWPERFFEHQCAGL